MKDDSETTTDTNIREKSTPESKLDGVHQKQGQNFPKNIVFQTSLLFVFGFFLPSGRFKFSVVNSKSMKTNMF